jgi:hypothetical protein
MICRFRVTITVNSDGTVTITIKPNAGRKP